MKKQIQKTIFKLLEEELVTVLALCFVGLGLLFGAQADSANTSLSVTILPAGGVITVTQPDGGETWNIGSSNNITWTSNGFVDTVKIELQRSSGGDWEVLTSSTEDDGSHPWIVTSPATTDARVRITRVNDGTVTDTSDGSFTISTPTPTTGGGRGGGSPPPGIYTVTPRVFANNSTLDLTVDGFNLYYNSRVFLGLYELTVKSATGDRLVVTVPAGVPAGQYTLSVQSYAGRLAEYGSPVIVYAHNYQAFLVGQSDNYITMSPGARAEVWVTLQNNSNYTWTNGGASRVRLGVLNDAPGVIYDAATWPLVNRTPTMEESRVEYGEAATFRFYIQAPETEGTYVESFAPVIDGVGWMTSSLVRWHVQVTEVVPPTTGGTDGYYSAKWLRQSDYLRLRRGETATLWVEFENTGTLPWLPSGNNPVRLGASRPLDRLSVFRTDEWVLANRPANINRVVGPGEVGRFSFKITAPTRLGRYREYFRPVAEFITWMEDQGVYWDLIVSLTPDQGPARIEAEVPSTGGVVSPSIVPSEPTVESGASYNFADTTERIIRGLTSWAESLFGSLADAFSGWF